jgi:hypothetical protein
MAELVEKPGRTTAAALFLELSWNIRHAIDFIDRDNSNPSINDASNLDILEGIMPCENP